MDPVTLAVVRGALEQIGDEMDQHLIRAALSPIISETNDCAHGIYDPLTGETIAQGGLGLPMFLANMQFTVQRMIPFVEKAGGFRPGDVWITNDPYLSGTHLNDVILISPHFVDGELFALFANTGHWMDMGGGTPGGWVPTAQEIHQEGIIIPPLKLVEGGKRNEGIIGMITANVRLPQQLLGDLSAMINVFAIGQRGLDDLIGRYGVPVLKDCIAEMMSRSETQMRSYISDMPDGTYRVEDFFDNDGVVDAPLKVRLALTVTGSDLSFDFAGTDGPAVGPMNISDATTRSMCFVALKHIFPDVPVNGGAFRPTRFAIPEGCILSASYPSAVGGTTEITQRIVDVVFGAFAQAMPALAPAAPFGTTGVATVSGRRPDEGGYFVAVYPYPGGYGGSAESDGLINGTPPSSMAKFMSVEMSEHRYPVRFDHYAIREGSGGAGLHRGGCGSAYGIETLSDVLVSILGDRVDHQPFGVGGGRPAAGNSVTLHTGGKTWTPPFRSKAERVRFAAGDRFDLGSPGGGGYGDPLERDPGAIEDDLNDGLVGAEAARDLYGAVVTEDRRIFDRPVYSVDRQKTQAERDRRKSDLRRTG
ncbi:methylhydantoinase [Seohaeicola zhoushanensis]|uniref:Methylhydantoinase n=2 Tax=Seohaeicola zhoushanensis TaxID=1569283 RepID=A0A8J3H271_9RHOB|nr:methylhydantoinase [Seohaeicola zhoushanensis]